MHVGYISDLPIYRKYTWEYYTVKIIIEIIKLLLLLLWKVYCVILPWGQTPINVKIFGCLKYVIISISLIKSSLASKLVWSFKTFMATVSYLPSVCWSIPVWTIITYLFILIFVTYFSQRYPQRHIRKW